MFHHFNNGPFSFQVRIGPFLSCRFCHTSTPVACSLNSPEVFRIKIEFDLVIIIRSKYYYSIHHLEKIFPDLTSGLHRCAAESMQHRPAHGNSQQ